MKSDVTPLNRRSSWLTLSAYSAVAAATYSMHIPAGDILPTFYATQAGMPLAVIGSVALINKIIDAVAHPAIGYLSDRTQGRWGPRKPYIAVGVALGVPAILLLMNPPTVSSYWYLTITWAMTVFSWSLIEIPHMAWGGEVTQDYDERSRLFTVRAFFGMIGTAAIFLVPFLPFLKDHGFSREAFKIMSWLLAGLLAVSGTITVFATKAGERNSAPTGTPLAAIQALWTNRPLRDFTLAQMLFSVGGGMYGPLYALYLSSHLNLGSQLGFLGPVMMVGTIIGVFAWFPAMVRLGKHRAWALGSVLATLPMPLTLLLSPGVAALVPTLVIGFFVGAAQAVGVAAMPAIMSDIADQDKLMSGRDNSGQFLALYLFLQTLCQGIGTGVSLIAIGMVGYKVGQQNSTLAISVFQALFIFVPMALFLTSSWILFRFKIDRASHENVLSRLLARVTPTH